MKVGGPLEGANLPETADAFGGVRRADDGSEGERAVGLPGAAADHSLAFKGCTLSQYTSAYDSRGSQVSQVITVGRSASRGLQTTQSPSSTSSRFSSLFTRQRSIQSTTLQQISLHSLVIFGWMEPVCVALPHQICSCTRTTLNAQLQPQRFSHIPSPLLPLIPLKSRRLDLFLLRLPIRRPLSLWPAAFFFLPPHWTSLPNGCSVPPWPSWETALMMMTGSLKQAIHNALPRGLISRTNLPLIRLRPPSVFLLLSSPTSSFFRLALFFPFCFSFFYCTRSTLSCSNG